MTCPPAAILATICGALTGLVPAATRAAAAPHARRPASAAKRAEY
jgi:hypothetical protein